MARYTISIMVQAERLPEPIPMKPIDPGADPGLTMMMRAAEGMLSKVMSPALPGGPVFARPAGLSTTRNIEIRAESFAALAEIVGKFDQLAEQLECEHPSEQ